MLFPPERDQPWREPAVGQRGELMDPGMARRTEGHERAAVMLSGTAVMDVGPRRLGPAGDAARVIACQNLVAVTVKAPAGVGEAPVAGTTVASQNRRSLPAGAEERGCCRLLENPAGRLIFGEGLIEGHQNRLIRSGGGSEVRVDPDFGSRLRKARPGAERIVEQRQVGKDPDTIVGKKAVVDRPRLLVSERLSLHRSGTGQQPQQPQLGGADKPEQSRGLVPPRARLAMMPMFLDRQRKPHVHVSQIALHRW